MNDQVRLYGTRSQATGHVNFPLHATAQEVWDYCADRDRVEAVSVLVSAIEPLPAPKPVLPTTPGSVVLNRGFPVRLTEHGTWGDRYSTSTPEYLENTGWSLVFDAGAHDEGKTS